MGNGPIRKSFCWFPPLSGNRVLPDLRRKSAPDDT
jgi:hypothetical protein